MLAISVEFLLGTFRGDPEGTANTGRLDRGEWPPAPARLFAALVAADGTRDQCRVTDGSELSWMERLPPPTIHAPLDTWHQMLQQRFVVRQQRSAAKTTHQEYVARATAVSRPGVRVAPRSPQVVYSWDVDAPSAVLDSLRLRAARVGYLGAADSPVRIRVASRKPGLPEQTTVLVPDDGGDIVLGVPQPGDVRVMDRMYDHWRTHGASVTRAQFPGLRHEVCYGSSDSASLLATGRVVAWLRLRTPVSGRRVSAVTALFKQAVLSQHQRALGEPPALLHGHGFTKPGFEVARYLALPDVGHAYARGRIHGLALWMPSTADATARGRAREAARSIRRLNGQGVDVGVVPREGETRPIAANPNRWLRRSRRWTTVFPALHERHRQLDLPELARWCEHAGLPEPVAFRSTRKPLISGAVDLAPPEVNRPGRPGLPYSHVDLMFAEEVRGPVVIGAGRQRGLGLCAPMDEPSGGVG